MRDNSRSPSPSGPPFGREFYDRPVEQVARSLLGSTLFRRTEEGIAGGRIVEVEAYRGSDDSASHSFRGRTNRNASMFGTPGRAYVYSIHARYCMNVVADKEGIADAVLIRAIEPTTGLDLMRRRRSTDDVTNLARGPARLCEALAIDRRMDGWDLTEAGELWLAEGDEIALSQIAVTPRIGVTSAKESLLRYVVAGNPFVSGPKRLRG